MQLGIAGTTFFLDIGVRATINQGIGRKGIDHNGGKVGRNTCPMVRQCTRRPPSLIQTGYAEGGVCVDSLCGVVWLKVVVVLSWCWRGLAWRVAGFVRGLLDVAVSESWDATTAAAPLVMYQWCLEQ